MSEKIKKLRGFEAIQTGIDTEDFALGRIEPEVVTETKLTEYIRKHRSLDSPDINIIKEIIDSGVDVNHQGKDGETALMLICDFSSSDRIEMVGLLIKSGADVDIVNNYGLTALHHACEWVDVKVLQLLIETGVDLITDVDEDGDTEEKNLVRHIESRKKYLMRKFQWGATEFDDAINYVKKTAQEQRTENMIEKTVLNDFSFST